MNHPSFQCRAAMQPPSTSGISSLFLLVFFASFLHTSVSAQLSLSKTVLEAARIYTDSAIAVAHDCRSEQVQVFASKAIEYGTQAACVTCVAEASQALAVHAYGQGYMKLAKAQYAKAFSLFQEAQMSGQAAICASGVANCNLQLGLFDEAIVFNRQALELASATGDTLSFATAILCQGNFYLEQKMFEQAITHYQLIMPMISIHTKTAALHARALFNLASAQYQTNQKEEALKTNLEALRLARENDVLDAISSAYAQIAFIFRDKDEDAKALGYINKAIESDSLNNHQAMLSLRYLQKGQLYSSMKMHEKAIIAYTSAIHIAKEYTLLVLENEGNTRLAEAYDASGRK